MEEKIIVTVDFSIFGKGKKKIRIPKLQPNKELVLSLVRSMGYQEYLNKDHFYTLEDVKTGLFLEDHETIEDKKIGDGAELKIIQRPGTLKKVVLRLGLFRIIAISILLLLLGKSVIENYYIYTLTGDFDGTIISFIADAIVILLPLLVGIGIYNIIRKLTNK